MSLRDALDLAVESAAGAGGPFGAVVEVGGQKFAGTNRVTASADPTAHAEVEAIRAAARALGSHDLSGGVLYTSTYPCPMCFTAAMWARLERVVYAASPEDAAAAGFDDRVFWDVVASPASGAMVVDRGEVEGRVAPFEVWAGNPARVPY